MKSQYSYTEAAKTPFSVAAKIPAHYLQELRNRIDRLVVEGASFHEGKKALLPLCAEIQKSLEGSA